MPIDDAVLALLRRHVELFNENVRSGDFAPTVALFADDAELDFEGVPAGPFHGRAAIAAAYREQPPDDTITVEVPVERDGVLVVRYAWARDTATSGEMRLTPRAGEIARLVVTFDRSSR